MSERGPWPEANLVAPSTSRGCARLRGQWPMQTPFKPDPSRKWNLRARARCFRFCEPTLNFMQQEQDKKNDKDQPDNSRRTVAPGAAMRPSGDGANENQNKNDDENCCQQSVPPAAYPDPRTVACRDSAPLFSAPQGPRPLAPMTRFWSSGLPHRFATSVPDAPPRRSGRSRSARGC
jgi:hypothetical protein